MTIDLSPTVLVRGGSALLFLAFTVVAFAGGRRRAQNVTFGIWAFAYGIAFASGNVLSDDRGLLQVVFAVRGLSLLTAGVALLALLLLGFPGEPRPTLRALRVPLALGLANLLITLPLLGSTGISLGTTHPWLPKAIIETNYAGQTLLYSAFVAIASAFAIRGRGSDNPAQRSRLAITAAAFGIHIAFLAGATFAAATDFLLESIRTLVVLAALVGTWLWAVPRVGVLARNVALTFCLVAIVGVIDAAFLGGPFLGSTSPWVGVIRTLMAGILAWAVIRHDLLGIRFAVTVERRATLATLGLIAFFAIAQVGQQYLSDSMGVVLGGAAAGALLFAAVPLQKMAERLTSRERMPTQPATGSPREETFRQAVRVALRDRRLTRVEERAMTLLAVDLGIRLQRAYDILDDEASGGARPGPGRRVKL